MFRSGPELEVSAEALVEANSPHWVAAASVAWLHVYDLGAEPETPGFDAQLAMLVKARMEPAIRTCFVSVLDEEQVAKRYPQLWELARKPEPWATLVPKLVQPASEGGEQKPEFSRGFSAGAKR